jgi:hypothetical protein
VRPCDEALFADAATDVRLDGDVHSAIRSRAVVSDFLARRVSPINVSALSRINLVRFHDGFGLAREDAALVEALDMARYLTTFAAHCLAVVGKALTILAQLPRLCSESFDSTVKPFSER